MVATSQEEASAECLQTGVGSTPAPSDNAHDIRDLVSFRLSRLVHINNRTGEKRFKTAHNLNLLDWSTLGLTYALDEPYFGDITRYLNVDKGQLSRSVKTLVAAELIESIPDSQDKRRTRLRLTEVGRVRHQEILDYAKSRNDIVLSCLSPQQVEQLDHLLGLLEASIVKPKEDGNV